MFSETESTTKIPSDVLIKMPTNGAPMSHYTQNLQ